MLLLIDGPPQSTRINTTTDFPKHRIPLVIKSARWDAEAVVPQRLSGRDNKHSFKVRSTFTGWMEIVNKEVSVGYILGKN
jgi:hypothetical protein